MKIKPFLLLLPLLLATSLVHAQKCDGLSVAFIVDGVNKWEGLSSVEIQRREPKTEFSVPGKNSLEGLTLKDLLSPYAKKGTLLLSSCDGSNTSYEVVNLLADGNADANIFLTLSKKNFFKLMKTDERKPILKKVFQLKLIP
ncbi:MAG: hypothetical protein ACI9LO_001515 [Planctomycetota bacterium]|jgi:hypothetical protein